MTSGKWSGPNFGGVYGGLLKNCRHFLSKNAVLDDFENSRLGGHFRILSLKMPKMVRNLMIYSRGARVMFFKQGFSESIRFPEWFNLWFLPHAVLRLHTWSQKNHIFVVYSQCWVKMWKIWNHSVSWMISTNPMHSTASTLIGESIRDTNNFRRYSPCLLCL